ncbi:hypothetical protein [uncultured Actinomyces sp.]|uniref:hypothetical protein n=1 Tax=uncultured Actinomyces sp. TaxID=249061 RepID=UPI00261DCC28|nr:hypothetical protein [uncultured Actinomyces sp.]
MDNQLELLELDMQELEPMDAPFWGTAASVVSGISAVSGTAYTVFKSLVAASVIAT